MTQVRRPRTSPRISATVAIAILPFKLPCGFSRFTTLGEDPLCPTLAAQPPRVYFNAGEEVVVQLAMFGFVAKEGDERGEWRKEYRYRIDSLPYFLKLIRNGFKVGRWPR